MTFYGVDISDLSVREINVLFRQHDESHLWPILGRFSATERAIRRLRRNILRHIGPVSSIEYAAMLESEISLIVNKSL